MKTYNIFYIILVSLLVGCAAAGECKHACDPNGVKSHTAVFVIFGGWTLCSCNEVHWEKTK